MFYALPSVKKSNVYFHTVLVVAALEEWQKNEKGDFFLVDSKRKKNIIDTARITVLRPIITHTHTTNSSQKMIVLHSCVWTSQAKPSQTKPKSFRRNTSILFVRICSQATKCKSHVSLSLPPSFSPSLPPSP